MNFLKSIICFFIGHKFEGEIGVRKTPEVEHKSIDVLLLSVCQRCRKLEDSKPIGNLESNSETAGEWK